MDAQVERLIEQEPRSLNGPIPLETGLSLNAGQPDEWTEPQEDALAFPVAMLPPILRDFVEAVAEALPVPPDLVALPALVAAGAAIGNTRRIQLKESWSESAALFGAIVSPPGTIKTEALNLSGAAIRAAEKTLKRRTWTSDVTVERFATLLQENPRGLCLIVDELSAWVKSMNQYKNGKGADKQFYMSAWSGTDIRVDRQTDSKTIHIVRPTVSVVGCVPPDVLPDLIPDKGKEDGFVHRVLFAWPEPISSRWNEAIVSLPIQHAYDELLAALYKLSAGPIYLPLTDDAKQQWVEWHDAHLAEMENPLVSPYLQGAYAKLKGYGARLALIHAICCAPSATTVGVDSIMAAVAMTEYFKIQAGKVDAALCRYVGTGKSAVERCKEGIVRRLLAKYALTKRDIQKNMNFKADIFNAAWDFLTHPQLVSTDDGWHWSLRSPYRHTDTDNVSVAS